MSRSRHQRAREQQVTRKYLSQYAEPEAGQCLPLVPEAESFDYVLCLPLFDENTAQLKHFVDHCRQANALLITVINQPASLAQPSAGNIACEDYLHAALPRVKQSGSLSFFYERTGAAVMLVDRYREGEALADAEGVGLARKIAADIACSLISAGRIRSQWIFCSDADATLPSAYFDTALEFDPRQFSALLYRFRHCNAGDDAASAKVQRATEIYEHRLHQYQQGLQQAGSPYAYQSLGSILCLSVDYYAQARGFPRRNGAEDFYLLNKLRKLAPVHSLQTPTIVLQSRVSQRAPFGTGPAVAELLASNCPEQQPIFYHPRLFTLLEILLYWFEALAQTDGIKPDSWHSELECFAMRGLAEIDDGQWIEPASSMADALRALGFTQVVQHAQRQHLAGQQLAKHLHEWFDAFRTLKWLHALRAENPGLENRSYEQLQDRHCEPISPG